MSHVKQSNVDSDKVEIGHSLMSEEHGPNDLVKYARLAEDQALLLQPLRPSEEACGGY
ncbi:MAG: hypothetical protein ABR909_13580 [Candidatus Bathyarchaeia archaeon]|jgi:hypothetical protein